MGVRFEEDAALAVFGASVATEAAFAATACGCMTARLLLIEANLAWPSARPSNGVAGAWSRQCDVEGTATCAKTDDILAAQNSPLLVLPIKVALQVDGGRSRGEELMSSNAEEWLERGPPLVSTCGFAHSPVLVAKPKPYAKLGSAKGFARFCPASRRRGSGRTSNACLGNP